MTAPGLSLRPYQHEALQAISDADATRLLISLPTGTGKTVVFSELIRRRGGTALVLAHRDELLTQAAGKLRTVAPELALNIGLVQAGRNDVHAPIVMASVQTLARTRRRLQLPREYTTVVVDEAHHATAPSYVDTLTHVADSPLVVGFTATPERSDKKSDLRNVFEELAYARSLEEMIREGWLCDLRAERVTIADLDLAKVKKSRGDYQAAALGAAMQAAGAVDHAVAAWDQHAPDRKGIAFFPTVELSREAAALFTAAGLPAGHVDGTTPRDERRATLAALTTGKVQIICNVGVLTEGYDEPSIECVMVAAPTRSRIRYAQMVGRGTRLHPGKTDCLILDLAGVTTDLSLQSAGALFGLRTPPKPGEKLTRAKERQDKADARRLTRPKRARPMPTRTSSKPVRLFNSDAIAWTHVGDRWIVGLKNHQHLVLDPTSRDSYLRCAGCSWTFPIDTTTTDERCTQCEGELVPTDRTTWRVLLMGPNLAKVIARNLDLGYAQGAAEGIIRDAGLIGLADRDAPWRKQPATPGQRRYAHQVGAHPPADATKGDVADLITAAIATERLARFDRATTQTAQPA